MEDEVWGDESALPLAGVAVTVEDIEVRKEDARLELTEPLRESTGESAGGGS